MVRKRFRIVFVILSLIMSSVIGLSGCSDEGSSGNFYAHFLPTGKSDCTVLVKGNRCIIIDAADEDDCNIISSCLDEHGISKIDALIISHYDKDHIGSAPYLIENYSVKKIYMPSYSESSNEYSRLLSAISDNKVDYEIVVKDTSFSVAGMEVLINPPSEFYDDDNNNSLIATVSYGETSMLFMGDALKKRCEEFEPDIIYDIVKAPHHGDSNKAFERLLEGASECVITTDDLSTVEDRLTEKLEKLGINAWFTFDGEVVVTSDGVEFSVSQE